MSRSSAQRIADVLKAVERCQKYFAALDRDVVETYLLPLAEALEGHVVTD